MLQRKAQTPSSQSAMPQPAEQQTPSEVPSRPEPQSQEQPLPNAQGGGWSESTRGELERANRARHYELLPGAIMGLTIEALGIHEAPVFDSDSQWALANGVAHHPQTSLPWSQSAQRNVYLAGHRMGYRGTWSRMIFYNLHKLKRGDKVLLKEWINGKKYYYVHVYYWWETPDQMTHIRDDWYYCKYHKYVAADSPKPYFEAWVTYKPTGNHYWEEFFYTEELV
jgi:Sortase domain